MKNYKNFVTKNAIHSDGFSYIDIRDEKGVDWYKSLKEFQDDTYKIIYYSGTKMVIGYNKDASMIAPFEGTSVIEVTEIPAHNSIHELLVIENDFKLAKLEQFQFLSKDGKVLENKVAKEEYYLKQRQDLQRKYLSLKKEKEEFAALGFDTAETDKEMELVLLNLEETKKIIEEEL